MTDEKVRVGFIALTFMRESTNDLHVTVRHFLSGQVIDDAEQIIDATLKYPPLG